MFVCLDCTTVFAPAPTCPHCGSAEHYIQGEPMPKNTLHGGASHELDIHPDEPEVVEPEAAVEEPVEEVPAVEPEVEDTPAAEEPEEETPEVVLAVEEEPEDPTPHRRRR